MAKCRAEYLHDWQPSTSPGIKICAICKDVKGIEKKPRYTKRPPAPPVQPSLFNEGEKDAIH